MSKIREIIRLTETAGLSIRKTSRALNVSRIGGMDRGVGIGTVLEAGVEATSRSLYTYQVMQIQNASDVV